MNIVHTGINTPFSKLLSTSKNYALGKFSDRLTLTNTIETKGFGFFILSYANKSITKLFNIQELQENDAIIIEDKNGFVYVFVGIEGVVYFEDIQSDCPLEKLSGSGVLYIALNPDMCIRNYKFIKNARPDHFCAYVDDEVYIGGIFLNDLEIDGKKYNYLNSDKINSYLIKINNSDITEWTKIFNGELSIYDVAVKNGTIYIVGCYRNSIDLGQIINGGKIPTIIIAALDKNLNLKWFRRGEQDVRIILDKKKEDTYYTKAENIALADDGIYVTGTGNFHFFIEKQSLALDVLSAFIIKLSYDSKIIWAKKIDLTQPEEIEIDICPRLIAVNDFLYVTGFCSHLLQYDDKIITIDHTGAFILRIDKEAKNPIIKIINGLEYNFNRFITFREKLTFVGGFKNFIVVDSIERRGGKHVTFCVIEIIF